MKITILSTSDIHSHIFPTSFRKADDNQPFGYLKAAQVVNDIRQAADPNELVLYIENGDFIEGNPMAEYAHDTRQSKHYDQLYAKMLNHMHPTAAILGNHEFSFGQDYLKDVWAQRHFPILCANIDYTQKHGIADSQYLLLQKNGLKVAILGLTTQYVPEWEPEQHITGLKFRSALDAAKKWVPILRQVADIVIVAYHGGFEGSLETGKPVEALTGENEASAILKQVPGIDAMVTGHQHREIATKVNGVPVTQPGFRGAQVGCISLEVGADHQVSNSQAQLISTSDAPLEPYLQQITTAWQTDVEHWLSQPLATIDGDMLIHDPLQARLHGHAYLDLINRVQMDATGTDIAATSLFNDEVRGFDHEVTIRNVLNSYVYPNTPAVEETTGADLKAALERCASMWELKSDGKVVVADKFLNPKQRLYNYDYYSGIDYTFDLRKPVGHRVTQLQYHGKDVQPNQVLKFTTGRYRASGGGKYPMFSAAKITRQVHTVTSKLIIKYLQQHPHIKAHQPHNLTIIK